MQKFHRAVLRAASDQMKAVGGSIELIGTRSHPHLLIEINGRSRRIAVANSPSQPDHALWNSMKDVKRAVRELTDAG